MASRFATISKDEILAVNETAAPTNTKNRQNWACRCLLVDRIFFFLLNLQQNHKKWSQNTVN